MDAGAASPAWQMMGVEVVSTGDGESVLEMKVREDFSNQVGVCHGGFIGMLADSAMGRALGTGLEEGAQQMSFDLKLTFLSPAEVGQTLTAAARVLHKGRRTAVTECHLNAAGRLVATATASFIALAPR